MMVMDTPARAASLRRREHQPGTLLLLALLALLLSLGWTLLSAGRGKAALLVAPTPPGGELPPSASVTYRQPAAAGAGYSLEAAQTSVRAFLGQPDLRLTGAAAGPTGAGAFLLDTPLGDSFLVDRRTAEVLEANLAAPLRRPSEPTRLLPPDLEQRAERYVAERFLGFEALSLVERTVEPARNDHQLHRFTWALLSAESGAELPTSVSVALTADRGEVVWYLAQREATVIGTRPTVGREAAVAAAAGWLGPAGRWDTRQPASTRLQVVHDDDNRQRLVWAVSYPGRFEAEPLGRPAVRVLIDAESGQPLDLP
jgi:hypothetical protein